MVLEARLEVLEALLKILRSVWRFLRPECKPINPVMEALWLSLRLTLIKVPEDRLEALEAWWALKALLKAPAALLEIFKAWLETWPKDPYSLPEGN